MDRSIPTPNAVNSLTSDIHTPPPELFTFTPPKTEIQAAKRPTTPRIYNGSHRPSKRARRNTGYSSPTISFTMEAHVQGTPIQEWVDNAEHAMSKLRAEKKKAEEDRDDAITAWGKGVDHNQKLERRCRDLNEKLGEAEAAGESLQRDIEGVIEEKEELKKRHEALVKRLEKRCIDRSTKLSETEAAKKGLQQANEELRGEKEELQGHNKVLVDDLKNSKVRSEYLGTRCSDLSAKLRESGEAREHLQRVNESYRGEKEGLLIRNNELQKEKEESRKQHDTLQGDNDNLRERNKTLFDKFTKAKDYSRGLEKDSVNFNAKLVESEAARKSLQQVHVALQGDTEDLRKQRDQLQTDNGILRNQNKVLTDNLKSSKDREQDLVKQCTDLKAKLSKGEAVANRLLEDTETLRKKKKALFDELRLSGDANRRALLEKDMFRKEKDEAVNELSDARKEHDGTRKELKTEKEAIFTIRAELEKKEGERQGLEAELAKKEGERKALEIDILKGNHDLVVIRKELLEEREKRQALERELVAERYDGFERERTLQEAIGRLNEKIRERETQETLITAMESKIHILQVDKAKLKARQEKIAKFHENMRKEEEGEEKEKE